MSDSGGDEETSSPVANKWEDDLLDGGVDDNGDCDAFGKSTFYLNTIKKRVEICDDQRWQWYDTRPERQRNW